jgi:hypothetical protein
VQATARNGAGKSRRPRTARDISRSLSLMRWDVKRSSNVSFR